jgi:threonine dehydrogenase-like Zn-dependent dehydrogenase
MSTQVRAAVMTQPGVIEVQRFPMPDPEPGAVVLEMSMSGICGTDKHTFRGEVMQYAGTPHERQIEYPLICGHENVGRVAALGGEIIDSEGRPLRPGDRVVPGANITCGRCWYCQSGQPYYMCERLEDYGNSLGCAARPHLFGGWSEYMYLLPGTRLFRVPDELPDHVAVLTEPMAVTHGFERARRLNDTFAETVAVFGVGSLGMCHLIKARLMGAGRIVAIDRLPTRLASATPALYAVVIIDDVEILYYNKDQFPQAPQTWDDIFTAMKSKAKPPNLYGWSARGVKGNPIMRGESCERPGASVRLQRAKRRWTTPARQAPYQPTSGADGSRAPCCAPTLAPDRARCRR